MSAEKLRELKTLASVCPELNMANYTEDDVRHLNDWAVEISLLVEQYALSQQPATPEPVYWEWRHLSTHPDTVDFGQWSEWQRVEARNAIHTIEDALAEFRAYIAQGYKYELRALYTHPAPSVPATGEPVQATPNFTQLMQVLDGLNRCHSRDSKVEFLRIWIRDWTQHKVDKLTHPAPSVPDGYVLVPIEPTQAMMNVQTWDFSSFYSPREIWAAMLAAKDTK